MLTADRVKAALAAGQLATLRAALEYDHKRTLLIDDGIVFVGRLRLQLDGFVKICRPGSYVNIQGPVYDGNQLILESFSTLAESHVVSTYLPPPTRLFELTDARWEKLEPVISKRSSLLLVHPKLSLKNWRSLATCQGPLHVFWKKLPSDYESILEQLAERRVVISLPRRLTDVEKAVFQRYPKHANIVGEPFLVPQD
jgi:hypothetical protein